MTIAAFAKNCHWFIRRPRLLLFRVNVIRFTGWALENALCTDFALLKNFLCKFKIGIEL